MTTKGAVVAALAAALAMPLAAQAQGLQPRTRGELGRMRQGQQTDDARRPQAPGQAQAQAHEKGTPSPLGDAQRKEIGTVWTRNQLAEQAGALAQSRGKSQEVKNLGRWLAADHKRVAQDLGKLVRDRGADPATLPPAPEGQQVQGELGALGKLSGDEFDRAFVAFQTRNTPTLKDAAGRARDATPGSDAELKGYLDQLERMEIGHRDAARQLESQRQARTPPPAPPRPAPTR